MKNPKIILITGATSGIGRAAALHFAAAGHLVIATGRNREALARLQAEDPGARLITTRLDVTDPSSIEEARAHIATLIEGRAVDVLINNAGYGLSAPITEVDPADLRRQFETNVFGLVAVTRAFVPAMQAKGAGTVINVSSVAGQVSFPFFGPYTGSKHAVEAISDALRVELRPFGVRVVVIEPGPIDTGFAETTMNIVDRYRSDDSAYAAVYARADAIRARSDKLAAKVDVVIRAMERAIRSRRPAPRYVVPFSSRLLLALLRLLPTRLRDIVFARALGLHTARLPAKAPSATPTPVPVPQLDEPPNPLASPRAQAS
jgi:NADP-dependent 3-hydroxy acid dehydrogenase YdfG